MLRPTFFQWTGILRKRSGTRFFGGECFGVYLDLVVVLNFLVDYLLLLGVNLLTGMPIHWHRSALAAAFGGIYAGSCLLPGFSFLGNAMWRAVSLGLMSGIAFGWNAGAIHRGCLFVVLSMALGGIALGLQKSSFLGLLLAAIGLAFLCTLGFSGIKRYQEYLPVELTFRGMEWKLTALRDTGNTLKDPLTGEPVMILGAKEAERLTGLTRQQLTNPVQTMLDHSMAGLRLIPYRTVDQTEGMLLAISCDRVRIGQERGGKLVALAPQDFPEHGAYQALTGGAYGAMDSVFGWTAAAGDRLLHRRQRRAAPTAERWGGTAGTGSPGARR